MTNQPAMRSLVLRIAFVHQPQNIVVPPVTNADPIALWTDQVARGLRKYHSVVCYSRRGPNQAASSVFWLRNTGADEVVAR